MNIGGVSQYLKVMAEMSPGSSRQVSLPRTEEEALRLAAREFESLFISELLKEMRRTEMEGGLFGKDRAMQMYGELRDEALAGEMAGAGGLGIGKMLFEELRKGA